MKHRVTKNPLVWLNPRVRLVLTICLTTIVALQVSVVPSRAGQLVLVAGSLDEVGGSSASAHFSVAQSSGGQSTAIGPSLSSHFVVKAGFVYMTAARSGDVNGDGSVSISDVVYVINYIFASGPEPQPYSAGDVNCDGLVSISDAVYLINYIFAGGSPPCLM